MSESMGPTSPMKRVEDWKSRLIDLSRKNNLLYFKKQKYSNLTLTQPDAQKIFELLVLKKKRLEFYIPQQGTSNAPAIPKEVAKKPTANQLVCDNITQQELGRRLKWLKTRSLIDYRERGVRILFAVFGTLNWVDAETKEAVQSPLILVPLELRKETIRSPYKIGMPPVEDEVVLNPALQTKLRNDFKIDLPTLPEEWEETSLDDYYNLVDQAVADWGWKTEQSTNMGLFSYQKLVIYKDLESNAALVAQNPIIRAIAGIKGEELIQSGLPDEKDVDKIELPAKTYQVLDADSSQRVAIEYAQHGQSFVMKGPPGTGKSQTIANIISQCIANGKSVLFVSEKMAALEVVYKRLSQVGLAHFCLELHSSKANKQQVVAELKRSLDENLIPRRLPSNHEFDQLTEYRDVLNGYVAALHDKHPSMQKSVYEVLSIIASLEREPFVPISLNEPGTLTPQKMRELEDLVSQLSKVWQVVEEPDFPWMSFRAETYNLKIRSELLAKLKVIIETLSKLELESKAFSAKLGVSPPETYASIKWLLDVSNLLFESPRPEKSWLTSQADALLAEAKTYLETSLWIKATRAELAEHYTPTLYELPLSLPQDLELAIANLAKATGVNLTEGEALPKLVPFLTFAKNTALTVKRWRNNSQILASMLGLDTGNFTISQLKQLSRIALLCFSQDKPDPQMFDVEYIQQVQETIAEAKTLYEEFGLIKDRLALTYNDGIYQLNIEELIANFSGPYQSSMKFFNSNFHRDQNRIAQVAKAGKVPKDILQDLIDARKVNNLSKKAQAIAETVQNLLGHYYHKNHTDFQGAERAIQLVKEIQKLSWLTPIPEPLIKILTAPSSPSPMIKHLGEELSSTIEKWESQVKGLEELLPQAMPKSEKTLVETTLPLIEEWAAKIDKQLTPLCNLTRNTLKVAKSEPKSYKQLISDLKNEEAIRENEAQIVGQKAKLQEKYGKRFQGLQTDWQDIVTLLEWCKKVQAAFGHIPVTEAFADIAAKGPSAAPSNAKLVQRLDGSLRFLSDLQSRFESELCYQDQKLVDLKVNVIRERIQVLRDRVDDLQVWIDYRDTKNRFSLLGLDQFFGHLVEQKPLAAELLPLFRKSVYQEWINNLYNEDPKLGRFRRENHEQLIADFKKLDQELIQLTSGMVIDSANSRKPQDILIQAADAEACVLSKEAAKKRRLMPIRNLLQKIPHLLVKLKPCLLMGPISVSQFLPPGMKFDLVLFDEASQLLPEDAINAIYRGKTVVVAGDNKQLPPTLFFQKNLQEDLDWDELSDEDVEVFDSILDECLGIGLPVKTLKWHYRSKHESLIAFSNDRFYDGTIITFPSAKTETDSLGVKFVQVPDGVYDRGGKRDNIVEAEKVTDLVFEHFKNYPKKTLGVVTFSISQMIALQEAIDRRLEKHPDFAQFFKEDRLEGFFIKNLENVQGDERDVIFFSVGYGYDQKKQITMHFGPLNKPGGERRLNVAVTRAREKVVLITSIKAEDIAPKTQALGVQTLRTYLNYAEKGTDSLKPKDAKAGIFASALVEDVAAEIKKMGYQVVPGVGCSDLKIDLAVVDPTSKDTYLLGIESDGPFYQNSSSARDRDRLRDQVLRQLGWRIHHIWAPAWVARRDSEIRRLKEALEKASVQQIEKDTQMPITAPATDIQKNQYAGIEKIGVPYTIHQLKANYNPYIKVKNGKATLNSKIRNEFHFPENRENQIKLLADLIANEGPVHFEYAVERLAATWGLKTKPKISHAVKEALNNLIRDHKVAIKGSFIWPIGLKETPIRVPIAGIPKSRRKPQYIAPEEIEAAMIQVAKYALGISEEALIAETAKVFGLNHNPEDAKIVFSEMLKSLIRERKLAINENGIITAS